MGYSKDDMRAKQRKTLGAIDIARYFIYLANREKKPISNKKLQKLVYYAQAWSLVFSGRKLFKEPIEAWVHGPAVRSLYVKYKRFGFEPIKEEVKEGELIISTKTKELLDNVWKLYGKMDSGYLEMLTHSEKPWQDARNGLQSSESSDNEITTKAMKEFYSAKLEQAQKK